MRWTRKGVPAATSFADSLQPYMAEWASAAHEQNVVTEHRLHACRRLGNVPPVVPTEDADAGDVRACYPATATCPRPRQGPTGRDLPGAPRPDHRHCGKLRYRKHITFIGLFIKTCVSNFVRSTMRWLRSCGSHRARSGSASPGGLRSTGARTRGSLLRP
jgi:hypothetical protein